MLLLISEELNHIVEKTEKLTNEIMDKIEGNSLSLSRFQILAHLIFGRSVTSFYSTKLLAIHPLLAVFIGVIIYSCITNY